jgi:Cu/Ag efflux pump CusA
LEVDFVPLEGDEAEHLEDDLRAILSQFPGLSFAIRGFLAERIEETLTGSTAEVVVKLFGEDLDSLDVAARRTLLAIGRVPGATDVQSDPPAVVPQATVRVRPELAAAQGLRPDEILAAVETATRGTVVAQVYEGNRATDVVVVLDSAHRSRPEDLGRTPLASASGRLVTLGQVATVSRTTGRFAIAHEGARRVQVVTANVQGRDVTGFTDEARAAVGRPGLLPAGVYPEFGGTAAAQRAAQRELLLDSLLAAGAILALFWLAFGEWRRMALVLANLPFALVGGTLAVFATGAVLSLGSLVGFVTLFGIATRNAVMLVAHYDHLMRAEGAEWNLATAVRGASERLGPILMTALVTAIALLPLALGSGDPGREIEGPMAIVILGGLATSTLLSLVVLPVLAVRVMRPGS